MTTTISEPKVDQREEQVYMGIRIQTPMKGMMKAADGLNKELNAWAKKNGLKPTGFPFLRFHVVDMAGIMDIEAGLPVAEPFPGDERVHVGRLPAGRYASLVFVGSGYTGNKTLHEWAAAHGLKYDRWDDPKGDAFRCRYERQLTDPQLEPRKTRRRVEVAIKLADES